MVQSVKQLFEAVSKKLAANTPKLMLNGDEFAGLPPAQYGSIEHQGRDYLELKGDAEAKGMLAGIGAMLMVTAIVASIFGFHMKDGQAATLMVIGVSGSIFVLSFLWEYFRPFPLPIIFNRRTQEIYFDMNGVLYHVAWEGIEAVAYEYSMVHQNVGRMVHGNLEILLHRFGYPEQKIVLNVGGHPAGKRIETLVALWEYLRLYMNAGPWFDEQGNPAPEKTLFNTQQLAKSEFTMRDNLKRARAAFRKEKEEKQGYSGSVVVGLWGAYWFHPLWAMKDIMYKLCKARSVNQWPEEVRERLKPDGPTTRLVDIEVDYAEAEKARWVHLPRN